MLSEHLKNSFYGVYQNLVETELLTVEDQVALYLELSIISWLLSDPLNQISSSKDGNGIPGISQEQGKRTQ